MAALLVSHLLSFVIAVIFLLLLLLVSLPRRERLDDFCSWQVLRQ